LQEGGASFQTTHWTLVWQAAQNESSESVQQALSAFCVPDFWLARCFAARTQAQLGDRVETSREMVP
jgi:hypothetical protein